MNEFSDSKMVKKVSNSQRYSDNKLVDSSSSQKTPQSPSDSALVLVQSPNKPALLPQERVTYSPGSAVFSQSGWTSVPNSPPLKRPSYSRDRSKSGPSWMFECESDSELGEMENSSSYFGYGKNLQRSQSNISEKSYSYLPDTSGNVPRSAYGSPYPYSSIGSLSVCNTASTSSIPSSVANMDLYYPPYSVSSAFPIPSSGYSPVCHNFYDPYWLCYSCRKPKIGSSTVAIDNKIEQAMDLVKSHLMYAVREEVEVLKEQIKELIEKNTQLEHENSILKSAASPETLALLNQPRQPQVPSSSS